MMRLVLVAVVLVAGCTDLPEIQDGVCGNGIVESREDCDHNHGLCVDCSWQCNDDNECPQGGPGFRCGADYVCHAPSGFFDQTPRAQHSFPVLGFRILDIDYDGINDVIGLNQTAMNVRYGEASAELPDEYNVVTPQVAGSAVLTHLVSDDVPDLVVPASDGLVVYTGAFGVPSPRQFPLGGGQDAMGAMGRGIDAYDAVQIEDTIGLFGGDDADQLRFSVIALVPTGPSFDIEALHVCSMTATEVTSKQIWHQVTQAAYATATATFVAFSNGSKTCVIKVSHAPTPIPREDPMLVPTTECPLRFPGQPDCIYQVEPILELPVALAGNAPVFADLDGDTCPSLVLYDAAGVHEYQGTTGGPAGCQLSASSRLLSITETGVVEVIGSIRLVPPAAGMAPDALITSFGIHAVPAGSAGPTTVMYRSDRAMKRAVVGDVDSDGRTDAVLTTSQPNLDVARRVPGQDAFLLVRTATSGPITYTVIADYDGDQRDDLAYVEDLGSAQRLSIAYGSTSGLAPGVAADAFRHVEYMAHMQVTDSTDPFRLVGDLIVIDIDLAVQNPVPEITILHGSPSRTMLSFFGLPVPIAGAGFRGVAAGDFFDITTPPPDSRSVGLTDVIAFQTFPDEQCPTPSVPCPTAIWMLPGLPNARFGETQFATPTMTGDTQLPTTTRVDECPNGASSADFCVERSKLVAWPVVISDDPSVNHDIVLGVDYRAGKAPNLMRFDPAAGWNDADIIIPSPFSSNGRIREMTAFDVDGDGSNELIATFGDAAGTPGHVDICPMHADGTFAAPCIDVATQVLGQNGDFECIDAAVGRIMPACQPEGLVSHLVALCRRPLADPEVLQTRWQSFVIPLRGVEGTIVGSVESAPVTVQGKLDQIQIGDVTGDAVDDVVVLDTSSGTGVLDVFVQRTTREYDACIPD